MVTPSRSQNGLDRVDLQLVKRLMSTGRATWADLADELGLTAPAVAHRVRRLEERGVIRHFAAWVDPDWLAPVAAYVALSLDAGFDHARFRENVHRVGQIQECHRTTGEQDYVLKLRCRDVAELEHVLTTTLPQLATIARMQVTTVLSTVKETPVLPLTATDSLEASS